MLTSKLIWQVCDLPHFELSAITPLSVGTCRPLQGSETEDGLSIPGCPAESLGGEGGHNGLNDSGPPPCAGFGSMDGSAEDLEVPERALGFSSGDGVKGKGKARKPYVVSRPREKWSEREHELFVEALRLFGRSWKAIETHIGTKTAVQIRSHAQKHFQKIQREKLSLEDGSGRAQATDGGLSEDIPPPRPKRRPPHPYPRKISGSDAGDMTDWGSQLALMDDMSLSSGALKDATVTQVAEAASAAAAAAAAAVVGAAAEMVQAQFQNTPPQGFPFWGLPPNALLQLAMQQPAQHGQSAAQFNQQHNLNFFQTHAAMHHHGQMMGPHVQHHQHAPHRKHHHHSGKHHSSKDSGQTQRLHRPLARPAGTTERSSLGPTTLTSYTDANTTGTPEGGADGGSPEVQAEPACALPAQYADEGDMAGARNEHATTSDQPCMRRGVPPRPAGSDGDSAISGEHSDGRGEAFGQAGDTGATSQDRTAGKASADCGPSSWQQAAAAHWAIWPPLPPVAMPPVWPVLQAPGFSAEDWRALIYAAATHASHVEIARLASHKMGTGPATTGPGSSKARSSGDKSPSPSAVARMERVNKMKQRRERGGLSLSGAGSGRRSASDIKQEGEENSPVSTAEVTNITSQGPSPPSVAPSKTKCPTLPLGAHSRRPPFTVDPAEGSGEGSREGSREGSGSGEGSNPTGNGTSGANNTSGNNNSGSGEAIRHSGRGSNNGNSGSGNGDSGSADHTHPHRAGKEAAAELANNGQSKAPLGSPHMAHMGHGAAVEATGTGSDESGAEMEKGSGGNSSGQGSGQGLANLGASPLGPTVAMAQASAMQHSGLANWYMNSTPGMHEQHLLQSQSMMSWPGALAGPLPIELMQHLIGYYNAAQHAHFPTSPPIVPSPVCAGPPPDATMSGNVTGQGFQPYKNPRSIGASGTGHASRIGPTCPSSGALSVASKRSAVHPMSAPESHQPLKKRFHSSINGGIGNEGLPLRKRCHMAPGVGAHGCHMAGGVSPPGADPREGLVSDRKTDAPSGLMSPYTYSQSQQHN